MSVQKLLTGSDLTLTKEWKKFVQLSQNKHSKEKWRQQTFIFLSVICFLSLIVIIYYYYPKWTTPKPYLEALIVEAGSFEMGSDTSSPLSKPKHNVSLKAFKISKYEVSNEQYAAFVNAMRWEAPESEYYDDLAYAHHPVVGVNWYDAITFCNWVGGRLPTEAEWEKTATWDITTKRKLLWPWGMEWEPDKIISFKEKGLSGTAPINSLPEGKSPVGAIHMVGNVSEWTSSIYRAYPYNSKDGRENPDTIAIRVVRGGSWSLVDVAALPTNRSAIDPHTKDQDLGFRVAWNLEED